jgi:hypothetical protein
VGGHVFLQSLIDQRSKVPVSVTFLTPEVAAGFGIGTDGTNAFSLSRFLVPYMEGFSGFAIFLDGADMLLRADLSELWEYRNGWEAIQVVPHDYRTKHPRKYIGTELEADNLDYPAKNQSSVIVWNCGHYMNRCLTPDYIQKHGGKHLHRFEWLKDKSRIGEIPASWNVLIGEQESGLDTKLAHFTLGGPFFRHYANCDHANEWRAAYVAATKGLQYTVPSER